MNNAYGYAALALEWQRTLTREADAARLVRQARAAARPARPTRRPVRPWRRTRSTRLALVEPAPAMGGNG